MKSIIILLTTIFLISCTSQQNSNTTKQTERPNILFILCDDLGYSDVGFNGGKDVRTPHLDALAANGATFGSAYTPHPFCGPSRTGIMTGRYPHTIGSPFNLPPNSEELNQGIPTSEIYISKMLKDAGYYTGIVGKWHLGVKDEFHPNNRGFDYFYGFLGGGHKYFPEAYPDAHINPKPAKNERDEYRAAILNNKKPVKETEYLTDAFSREAVNFVNDAAKKDNPFFLYLAYNAPHSPLEATKEDLEKFDHIKDKKRKTFAAMVYAVDRGVGEIVAALKANNQLENTLIIFLSDNGGKLKLGGTNYPLSGQKGTTTEGGHRTPMFFHYPNKIDAGKRYEHVVSGLDFYPTFAHLAGADIPKGKVLHGKNMWTAFEKNESVRPGEMIYVLRHRKDFSDVGARQDEWKLLRLNHEKWQLFNIEEDISEQNDLSDKYPEKVKEMVEKTKAWSTLHTEPQWFHADFARKEWIEEDMPHFEETFKLK